MQYTLTVEPLNRSIVVAPEQSLLEALQGAGISIAADCGGEGLCHHCGVLLVEGEVAPRDPSRWIERQEDGHHWILACQARLAGDATIELSPQSMAGDMAALGRITGYRRAGEDTTRCSWPLARRMALQLMSPSAADNVADWQRLEKRILDTCPDAPPLTAGLEVLRALPQVLRASRYDVMVTIADRGYVREVIGVAPTASQPQHTPGLAVDVGTSTVVVQVVDLDSGHLMGQAAGTNAQKAYGADVISRIIWAEQHPDGSARMQDLIIRQISELAHRACELSGCEPRQVVAASLAGNTTMATFAIGGYPQPIRREPHIPFARDVPALRARDLGMNLHPLAPIFFAPAVSGFVGGDVSAGVLATGMADAGELSLLVDVGTNGEIVLGNRDWLICCSCSAGPAFEGVDIAAGIPAVPGAIDRIEFDRSSGAFDWQTIGNLTPIGLCGTGLLEALAAMFRGGLLDRQGHLDPESPLVRDGYDEPEVVIVPKARSGTRDDLVLRESEIENLLRSKAAVYAGIASLLRALQLQPDDIQRLYIAGSFGNRLRVEEAVTIGLLPDVPRERISFAGNTSLAGAYQALTSREARERLAEIGRQMTYLELSTEPGFMDEFMAALFLPHTDLARFPSQRGPAPSLS